jgi:hypothetical protein
MNRLTITSTLLILNRLPKESVHNIASFLIKYNPGARGWVRGVNTCALFKKHYMLGGLTHKHVEVNLWKEVFPLYPRLHESYEKNYAAFIIIINPEMYVQKALDLHEKYYDTQSTMTAMRDLQTPTMSYSLLDSLLFVGIHYNLDLPKLLDILYTLHNWPQCFSSDNNSISSEHFWKLVGEYLEKYLNNAINNQYKCAQVSARNFIGKHIDDIDLYKYKHVYQCFTEEFIVNNNLFNRVQWSSITTLVPLGEYLLGQIMDCSNKRERFHGQNVNVAYIFSDQQVSEAFIEEWIVGKQYDQDHVWANIFNHQVLSDEFKEKYKDRLPKDSTTELRKLLNDTCKF